MVYIAGKKTASDRVHILEDHFHSAGLVYPTLAAPVTVTSSATAYTLGAFAEIVPASTIGSVFDIHFVNAEVISANGYYELVLYAVETEIGRVRFSRTTNQVRADGLPFQCRQLAADTQIQAKLSSSNANADTAGISLKYHTY